MLLCVQNEVSCKTEALKVKMISEQKEIGLNQELDAVQEAMLQCKSEYEHIQREIIQQVQHPQPSHRYVLHLALLCAN